MHVVLLTIGDELLIGQTVNTNAAWLGEQLSGLGLTIRRMETVPDEAPAMRAALARAYDEVPLVVTTGGLGPTHDDITKDVVADFFERPLAVHDDLLARVQGYYEQQGRTMPARARNLAEVPEGFDLLANPVGTAPGLWYEDEGGPGGRARLVVVLPGVPREMKGIVKEAVVPRLHERPDLRAATHRTLRTSGLPESRLQEMIADVVEAMDEHLALAYLPSALQGVRLRITAYGEDEAEAERRLDEAEAALRARVGTYIYGTGDVTLEEVVGAMLTERGLTVGTAESCTGGFVAHRLTNVPGSSAYVVGGIVAYANDVKVEHLGVDPADLDAHGAVSEPVARQMARGARRALGTDVAVATTGIAGPGGGTDAKPVGTIWLGYADAQGTDAVRLQLTRDRMVNKELFSTSALELLRRQLLKTTPAAENTADTAAAAVSPDALAPADASADDPA
jgi:nicotinamide-nucleotide amidase